MHISAPSWIEIDSDALSNNVRVVKNILRPPAGLLAVVKADAYGCGAVEVSRVVLEAGADWLGVTTLEEGQELRRAGITAPVLLLSPLLPAEIPAAVRGGLVLTVSSREEVEAAAAAGRELGCRARVHLEIETGMNRTGLKPAEAIALAREISRWPEICLEGISTHLAEAASRKKTFEQFSLFQQTCAEIEAAGIRLSVKHICNSAATLLYPQMHGDLVRVGTLLYGHFPLGVGAYELDLRDVWRACARILALKEIPKGARVGYGGDYVARRSMKVAVINIGYADGFAVSPIGRPKNLLDLARFIAKDILAFMGRKGPRVQIGRHWFPVVGRVGMQLSLVDVSRLPGVKVGDIVEIPLWRAVASSRLPRVYLRSGQPYRLRTAQGEIISLEGGLMS
ncbi:MAG: alanine racemase [Clostridia bacterium]|nr:alanine racemase [Clostridia bacterium]